MAFRLKTSVSKNSTSYFIIADYTNPKTKKRTTQVVEKLGNQKYWFDELHTSDPSVVESHLRSLVREKELLRQKDLSNFVSLSFDANKQMAKDVPLQNVGYLFPQKILHMLGLKEICEQIKEKGRHKFPLDRIISDLVCTRLIYPGSKRSSYNDASRFFESRDYSLDDVYRALPLLAKERYFIESQLYSHCNSICSRDTSVLYYDCTNFYFEAEEEDDFRMYGKSKENRPNPIVQYGLFMDSNGIPLADIVFAGNKNEQSSLRTLEEQIEKDFKKSKFIVCADAGLNSFENKIYNDKKRDHAYIVTQSIKKLRKNYRDWCLKTDGWKLPGCSGTYSIENLPSTIVLDGETVSVKSLTFYKEIFIDTEKKSSLTGRKEKLTERLIVTYSQKYKEYQEYVRSKKIDRALKLIARGETRLSRNSRDPKYYLKQTSLTTEGEVAEETVLELDSDKIAEEAKYDGFYCVATDLLYDDAQVILAANHQRWEIEESFQIMKSELEARPIYVSREESIKGHLLICFMALLVYRILEQYLNSTYTCYEIFDTLREMNVIQKQGDYYFPCFKRTDLTDLLIEIFGYKVDREILILTDLKKFSRNSKAKNSTQIKENLKKVKNALFKA